MLLQFNFSNFKSFKDEVSFDMSATKITEHSDHIVEQGYEKILPVSVIFGANASGKSNFLNAFAFMVSYIRFSPMFNAEPKLNAKLTPFLFSKESAAQPSSFEIFFIDINDPDKKTYQYGFVVNSTEVLEEWLAVKAKTGKDYKKVFTREQETISISASLKSYEQLLHRSLQKKSLVLSLGSTLNIPILNTVFLWFTHTIVLDLGDTLTDYVISNYSNGEMKTIEKALAAFLRTIDNSIKDFTVRENSDEVGRKTYTFTTQHDMDSGESIAFPLEYESDGTQKAAAIYPYIYAALSEGGILIVDELNAKLHPLLMRNIIQLFLDKKKNIHNTQLIFTTHDTWLLEDNFFRRDEIWFVEKNTKQASEMYSLAEIKSNTGAGIRKDENFQKNYLAGKYGSIPDFTHIRGKDREK